MYTCRHATQSTASSRTAQLYPLTLGFLVLSLVFAGCDYFPANRMADLPEKKDRVVVMTRNLYLGADLQIITGAESPQAIPLRVAQLYGAAGFPRDTAG